jgi:uncharacterized membrane protein
VLAIAITLLIQEVRVPHADTTEGADALLRSLGDLWPSYVGYVLSFVTIGIMWANHHAMFRYIRRSDHILLLLNTLFLMCIAFLPFATALLAEFVEGSTDERRIAVVVYGGTFFLIAVFFNLVWWYGTHHDGLTDPDADPRAITAITGSYQIGFVAYGATLVLAFVLPLVALVLYGALAVFYALPGPHRSH